MAKGIPGGYNGRILRVNLSSRSVTTEALDELFCRLYIGGAGFTTYYLWKELKPGVDALGPDNKLIFAEGPLTGLQFPGASRNSVGGKSPLKGSIAKSEAGGFWGAEFKRAGYDVLIVEGKSEKPVYLWIHDGEASIRDASNIWGKNTKETQQAIRSELGDDKIQVAQIGPAGENMVRYACIVNGLIDVAGRGGLGAVMGSKNLKAVAVRGHKMPRVANPDAVKELRHWLMEHMYESPLAQLIHELGTGHGGIEDFIISGNLPVRNFRDGLFPGAKNIHNLEKNDPFMIGMEGCYACPVRCKVKVKFDEPYPVDPDYGAPEYETIAALGSDCGIDNRQAIIKGGELCNAYSLDTISTGGVIAFAMECFEKGLLTTKDTGGMELKFGNDEAMLKCIELIARREGFGNMLAEGSARMAEKIGQGSEDFDMQVKGLGAGMHDPRLRTGMGLAFMINPHGADHTLATFDDAFASEEGIESMKPLGMLEPVPAMEMSPRKVALFKHMHSIILLSDCFPMCGMIPLNYKQLAELTAAVTGWDTGITEQLRVAERILTTARLFNVREGFTPADDWLPKRFFQPKTDGALSNQALDPKEMEKGRSYYYTLMGWDAEGVPLPEKVEELGIK